MKHASPQEVIYLSREEETANAWTHGAGVLLSCLALLAFLFHPGEAELGLRITAMLYAVSMGAVYFCSTMSHAVYEPSKRNRWRAWDQGMIYGLIAGTYSPFVFACSPQGVRIPLMIAVWGCAIFGFISKVLVRHRINGISTVTYMLLGWFPAVPLVGQTPATALWWMVAGGICYTVGVIFLQLDQRYRYFHVAWHLMVMAGSACHFWAIHQLLFGPPG